MDGGPTGNAYLMQFQSDLLGIPVGQGNIIFPEGNALKYLGEYFDDLNVSSPYEEDPTDIRAVSFSPDGEVDMMNGNVYETDIIDLLKAYKGI